MKASATALYQPYAVLLPQVPQRCLLCLLTTRRKPTLRKEVEVAQVWRYGSRKVATRV